MTQNNEAEKTQTDIILDAWEKDSEWNPHDPIKTLHDADKFFNKYLKILKHLTEFHQRLLNDHHILKGKRRAWYMNELSDEDMKEMKWSPPKKRTVTRENIENALSSDPVMIKSQMDVFNLKEAMDTAERILKTLNDRRFSVNAIVKFAEGVGWDKSAMSYKAGKFAP